MIEQINENGFYVRSNGRFYAFMENTEFGLDDPILKATVKGKTKVFPFTAKASTSDRDREGEVLFQKGLNFNPFKEYGEYNFNHMSHAMTGVPTGKKAWYEEPGWYCQGEIISGLPILDGYTTDMMVQQHNQLKKSGSNRGLCVSLEGKVIKRHSKDVRCVLKADIFNIAHTFRPQNVNCTLSMLAKAMRGETEVLCRDQYYDQLDKSLAVSDIGSYTKEDLEGSGHSSLEDRLIKHLMKKGYSSLQAKRHVYNYLGKKFKFSGSKSRKS